MVFKWTNHAGNEMFLWLGASFQLPPGKSLALCPCSFLPLFPAFYLEALWYFFLLFAYVTAYKTKGCVRHAAPEQDRVDRFCCRHSGRRLSASVHLSASQRPSLYRSVRHSHLGHPALLKQVPGAFLRGLVVFSTFLPVLPKPHKIYLLSTPGPLVFLFPFCYHYDIRFAHIQRKSLCAADAFRLHPASRKGPLR